MAAAKQQHDQQYSDRHPFNLLSRGSGAKSSPRSPIGLAFKYHTNKGESTSRSRPGEADASTVSAAARNWQTQSKPCPREIAPDQNENSTALPTWITLNFDLPKMLQSRYRIVVVE
jgi:hypothetical protein